MYTKPWVVDLILDLSGYTSDENLVDAVAVEPSAGGGAFLIPMATRLVASCVRQGRPIADCQGSLVAYELDDSAARSAREGLVDSLGMSKLDQAIAPGLANAWVRTGDYLLDASSLPDADYVIGNPPYIRLEDIPVETAGLYRDVYRTMTGRADLYIAFFEAALGQLKAGGVCSFICADRWMMNQYGAELRRLITTRFSVETIVEMHRADAFEGEVDAYPAITVIRRAGQMRAVVSSLGPSDASAGALRLADTLRAATVRPSDPGTVVVDRWFRGAEPWPCGSPGRLAVLRRLEEEFEPLESEATATKVGIGVATGLDKVYITRDAGLVEPSRLLPLAMASDTTSGRFQWSGHYLVNPWDEHGLVDLDRFPRLKAHLERNGTLVKRRITALKNPAGWYRTIDRVNMRLIGSKKLYIPDIKDRFNPVLDEGVTYPHHNLYVIQSGSWDLEVLGGLLLSSIGQLFIESYGVRMRGGYLRFQAQYLRRVRVPRPGSIPNEQANELIRAFRDRDRGLATRIAFTVYGVDPAEMGDVA